MSLGSHLSSLTRDCLCPHTSLCTFQDEVLIKYSCDQPESRDAVEIRDWRLEIRDWRLEIGDWRLETSRDC